MYEVITLNDLKNYEYNKDNIGWYEEYFDPEWEDYDGWDCALVRIENDVIVEVLATDGGEPEDNSFRRDWSWVPSELEKSYQRGYEAGLASRD